MLNEDNEKFMMPPVAKAPADPTSSPFAPKEPIVRKEDFEVDDISDWNAAAPSRFEQRIPKNVSRTVITVNERKFIFERSGGLFKMMGHLSDLIVIVFTATLISMALGAVFFAGKLTGAI